MEIIKINTNSPYINDLINMSIDWQNEQSCEGYASNTKETFVDKEIYIILSDNKVIAYLYGYYATSNKINSIQNINDRIFEIDEIYVKPEYRDKGVGSKLYEYVENDVKNKTDLVLLSTATKDYKKILHFYIDELGLTFWNARLYKRLK